jgi:transketolase
MNQIDIRDVFFDKLYELGSQNSNIIIISADMDSFSLRKFATDFPEQYMNVGVSEQNMINVAAGLAIAGKIVFCYSIASFATLRCLEQIKVNICSMNLPVTIVGAGAGFSFGYDGPTHHGHQDVSSMRLMPEMNIIELSSNDVVEKALNYVIEINSPCYIRLDKGLFPDWSHTEPDFKKGFRVIRPLADINLDAAKHLNERGINVGIIDIFRFKPFPSDEVMDVIKSSKKIISIEESCKTGGLGTALSEVIAQNDINCSFKVIGAPDKQFIEYGEREWFHEKYGLSGDLLVEEIFNFIIK